MCLKRIAGWCGRRVGWGLRSSWDIFKSIAKWVGLCLIVIIGTVLAFLGQCVLVILGGIVALCVIFLKVFAWITFRLMVTTKWFGEHITDYTENFFSNVIDTFTQEQDFLNQEVHLIVTVKKD